ncbi:MAG: hypothetical protein H6695_00390 [Deferribacteres bacterium]|nr:hypothetical protein [Deferribacteres bacterium]
MKKIAFVTYQNAPNLTADDALAVPHLQARGIEVMPALWDDPNVRWQEFDAIVLRSCWDYHLKLALFRCWLQHLRELAVPVHNAIETVEWNLHKGYLRELAQQGAAVPETCWLTAGESVDLCALLDKKGWSQAVIKPVVSATASQTWLCERSRAADFQHRLEAILQSGEAMVQVYLPEIASDGEWSLLYFGGAFSHAVKKRARDGDFRVQADFGGSAVLAQPSERLVRQAREIVQKIKPVPLYARVDGIERNGDLLLTELELIEPELFLRLDAEAAERFADVVGDVKFSSNKQVKFTPRTTRQAG